MFKAMSTAKFVIDGSEAYLFIDNNMSLINMKNICNRVIHYCIEIEKAKEAEEAQLIKDEEADKLVDLETSEEKAEEPKEEQEQEEG